MKLYLVRHADTEDSSNRIHQLPTSPLSEKGLAQAEVLAQRCKNIVIDIILASDYTRAHQTAEIVGKTIGKKVTSVPLLREQRRPSEIEGKPVHDPDIKAIRQKINDNAHEAGWHFSDEESASDLHARAGQFLDLVAGMKEEYILAVTHGLLIKMIGARILLGEHFKPGYFHDFTQKIGTKKTGITLLSYTEGQWIIETWNDKAHLG